MKAILDDLPVYPFTAADAAAAGVSAWALRQHVHAGDIHRVGRGLYQRTDTSPVDLDLVEAVQRAPRATLCLTSALVHHELVDAIPHTTDLALPRGTRRPTLDRPITWHTFAADSFDLGREEIPIAGTPYRVGVYSAERAIVDAFRLRDLVGYEAGLEALRTWLPRRGSNPAKLLVIARELPRSQAPLRNALAHLA